MRVERKVTAWERSELATARMVSRGMMQYKHRIVWNVLHEATDRCPGARSHNPSQSVGTGKSLAAEVGLSSSDKVDSHAE